MANTNLNYTLNLKNFFSKGMKAAVDETKKLDSQMGKLNTTVSRVGAGIAAYLSLNAIKDFQQEIVNSIAKVQSFNNSIMAASVSEAAGAVNLRFLNGEINRLGLNLNAARAGYKTFTGATMNTSIQGEKANKVFTN